MCRESIPSSFRDPSGFLFQREGSIFRQVNKVYTEHYNCLMNSGLYASLVKTGLLIEHVETEIEAPNPALAYKTIKPARVPFISYPYEWCFSQLKDAAVLTLEIQRRALDFGMSLKDASAYNVQFRGGRPVFIDTLSFENYDEGRPWVAYRQFCQHFLAPLVLMAQRDVSLSQLMRVHIDGIPLHLASALMPSRSWLRLSLLSHIHLHAKSQALCGRRGLNARNSRMSRLSLSGLIDNLESTIRRLKWRPVNTEWATYYEQSSYTEDAFLHKKQLVSEWIATTKPESVWDIGANTGVFSRIAGDRGIPTISIDADPAAVERNYLEVLARGEKNILPLLIDLTNPSAGIGWENRERMSLLERGPADLILALALIHHLVISNNVPFTRIASFLRRICRSLIIEFVPKDDPQVRRLLATREDIFPDYGQQALEKEFAEHFQIQASAHLRDSGRILYLMTSQKT